MKVYYIANDNAFFFIEPESKITILVEDFIFRTENIIATTHFTFPNNLTPLEGKKLFIYSYFLSDKEIPINWLWEIKEDYESLTTKKEFIKIELKNLFKKYLTPFKTFSFTIAFSPKKRYYKISNLISRCSNFFLSYNDVNEVLNKISEIIFKNEAKIKLGRFYVPNRNQNL